MADLFSAGSWMFPSNNYGQIYGIADAGVETFKDNPMKSLAREICQNSLDARVDKKKPVRVEFKLFSIAPKAIPGYDELKEAMKAALDFWTGRKNTKAIKFFEKAIKCLNKTKINCLRISDFNTTGLTGSKEENDSPWNTLIKATGASSKEGTMGGSFGIGKYAPFACSDLHTVFYSTSDQQNICAYQGIARLASFKDINGETTQGTGYFGGDKNSPIFEQVSLEPCFKRPKENFGTDIFILGFNGDDEWQTEMTASIIDGFLVAIYAEWLTVSVDNILVNKEMLPSLIEKYKDSFKEHADEYYQCLQDDKEASRFEIDLKPELGIKGKLILKLMVYPDYHRRVAMVRHTGMKIMDKGHISGTIPFAGVLFITGDEINSYLRNLENPQHLAWLEDRADDKMYARRVLKYFLGVCEL